MNMFEIALTPRGSPVPRRRPVIERVDPCPRWETTSPQHLEEPTAGSPRVRPAAEEPSPGLRIFEPESRTARARRLKGTELRYIAHPSFDDPDARDAILAPMPPPNVVQARRRTRAPAGLPPYLASLYDEGSLLSREQEAHLFRKMNYLKSRASRLRDRIDPARPRTADLDEIERHLEEALAIRNQIVRANLRLVVSIAKRDRSPHDDLFERVSDGNYVLIRAVERFDYSRGNKFSTYATWAIRNHFARAFRGKDRRRPEFLFGDFEAFEAAVDPRSDDLERSDLQERRQGAFARLLARLDDRERRIIVGRFGIGGASVQTLRQIGKELGISKERTRQIETRAKDKLCKLARMEEIVLLQT
jgi:RNA polymerase primary sigma factor